MTKSLLPTIHEFSGIFHISHLQPILTNAMIETIPSTMQPEFIEHREIFGELIQQAGICLNELIQMNPSTRAILLEHSNNVVRLRCQTYISSCELAKMDPTILTEILQNVDNVIRLKKETCIQWSDLTDLPTGIHALSLKNIEDTIRYHKKLMTSLYRPPIHK